MPNQNTITRANMTVYHPAAADVFLSASARSAALAAVDDDLRLNLWYLNPAEDIAVVLGSRNSMLQADLDYVMALLAAAGKVAAELAGAIARRDITLAADQTGASGAPDA